ncbi:MAG: OB-fold nucleic acid binding domain-containing protein [Candidatus Hydrothermarchaeaceae archaeon]
MEFEDIITRISNESNLGKEELKDRVLKKQEELGGLVTLEGAAHIVSNEIGINLFKNANRGPDLKIKNIITGMTSVDVVGRVLRVYPQKDFKRKDGSKGRVGSFILADDSGSVRTVFWDDDVKLIKSEKITEGTILRIRGGYSKESLGGEPEIHAGMRARITIEPKDVDTSEFPVDIRIDKKISELKEGDASVDVLCKVLRIYEPREFERDDKTGGKVANLVIFDETGSANLVLWDDAVKFIENALIKEGDTIKVKKGYVRLKWKDDGRISEPELNVGKYGNVVINPEENLDSISYEGHKNIRRYIKDLHDGDFAEVRGALVDIYDNVKIFDRKGKKGMVVNAVIDDGTANMRAAFYDKMAEILMDVSINDVIENEDSDGASQRITEILGREIVAKVRVRHSNFSGQDELIVQDINLRPDPKIEAKNLIEEQEV